MADAHQLAEVFRFDENDVQFNRQGVLSPAQLQKYENMNKSCVQVAVIITLILITLTAAVAVFGGPDAMPGVITLGVLTILGGLGTWFAWATRHDSYVLHQIEGAARLRTDRSDSTVRYVINIGGYEFSVDPKQYEVVEDGARYRIYYAVMEKQTGSLKTATKFIQSLERLG